MCFESAAASLGYKKLQPISIMRLEAFIGGKNMFVCLSTGCGKSQWYVLLPLVLNKLHSTAGSTTHVARPPIAPMKNQVRLLLGCIATFCGVVMFILLRPLVRKPQCECMEIVAKMQYVRLETTEGIVLLCCCPFTKSQLHCCLQYSAHLQTLYTCKWLAYKWV